MEALAAFAIALVVVFAVCALALGTVGLISLIQELVR